MSSIESGPAGAVVRDDLGDHVCRRPRRAGNWNDYEVLRMPQMPLVDVHLADSGIAAAGGIGEIGPGYRWG